MLSLARPGCTAERAFKSCISKVRNAGLKARLIAATQTVIDADNAFSAAAITHALHQIVRQDVVAPDITTEEMVRIYTQRMAQKSSPGRDIYDDIFSCSPHGRCPLCAQRTVSTLDHHLPKAHYPALAVAPLNLVPSCTDCNKAKLNDFPLNAEDVPLHPYFDSIDGERWLVGQVVETQPAAVFFQIAAPDAWNEVLTARVRNHFRVLGLGSLYASEAAEELGNIRHQLENIHSGGGADEVREELEMRAASCAANRINGWRTATYSAWAESDWFCDGGFLPN